MRVINKAASEAVFLCQKFGMDQHAARAERDSRQQPEKRRGGF